MKESRFIELLNLYVDHQLTPQEAAELDAALRGNPARRRTYQQYCRMQKACAVLFENERASAPSSPALARALADADRKIFGLPDLAEPARGWRNILTWGSGLAAAAAACVAAIVVLRTEPVQPAQNARTAAATSAIAVQTPAAPVASAATAPIISVAVQQNAELRVAVQKSFRFPAVSTFSGEAVTIDTPALGVFDATGVAWAKNVQMRLIRKVGDGDPAFEITRIAKPDLGAGILRAPSADAHEEATEATAIQYQK